MKKVVVEICMGTTCHIFGSSELVRVADFLEDSVRDRVEISGAPCLKACANDNYGGAPFVRVDGKIISRASVNGVLEEIRKRLGEVS